LYIVPVNQIIVFISFSLAPVPLASVRTLIAEARSSVGLVKHSGASSWEFDRQRWSERSSIKANIEAIDLVSDREHPIVVAISRSHKSIQFAHYFFINFRFSFIVILSHLQWVITKTLMQK
jgi:hypothetical protein